MVISRVPSHESTIQAILGLDHWSVGQAFPGSQCLRLRRLGDGARSLTDFSSSLGNLPPRKQEMAVQLSGPREGHAASRIILFVPY